jgi:hypothetical protein
VTRGTVEMMLMWGLVVVAYCLGLWLGGDNKQREMEPMLAECAELNDAAASLAAAVRDATINRGVIWQKESPSALWSASAAGLDSGSASGAVPGGAGSASLNGRKWRKWGQIPFK